MEPTLSPLMERVHQGSPRASEDRSAALYIGPRWQPQREFARHAFAATLSTPTLLHQSYLEIAERERLPLPDATIVDPEFLLRFFHSPKWSDAQPARTHRAKAVGQARAHPHGELHTE